MKRILTGVSAGVLAVSAAFAQSPPSFEVASIKPAAPQEQGRVMVRMGGDPGRIDYANVALKAVLARAYGVKQYQVSGPSWIDTERFDITAKVPDGVPKEQIPAMLAQLLTDRFKMSTHKETKDQSVYALVVGKNGPKLTKSEPVGGDGAAPRSFAAGGPGGGPGGAPPRGAMRMSMGGPGGTAKMEANGVTMAQFADMLSNMLDRPVVDQSGVEGNYDIALDVSMEDMAGMRKMAVMHGPGPGGGEGNSEGGGAASIFTAVQGLGLKLEPKKAPLEFVIVDRAEKVPTEN
jgi:uncharacterized protein (TIGR03435 family)